MDAMQAWLHCLADAGVDLRELGKAERRAIKNAIVCGSFERHVYRWFGCCCWFDQCKLVNLITGPRIGDWKGQLSWRLCRDSIWEGVVGSFWNMVEQPKKSSVPGAWNDGWDQDDDRAAWPLWRIVFSDRSSSRDHLPTRHWRRKQAEALAIQEMSRETEEPPPRCLIQKFKTKLTFPLRSFP